MSERFPLKRLIVQTQNLTHEYEATGWAVEDGALWLWVDVDDGDFAFHRRVLVAFARDFWQVATEKQ